MKPFSATLAALALVSAAHADVKSELQGRYAALSKAFKSRDVKIYEATLADGYVLEAMGRKVDRAAIISDFKRQMNIMKTKEWSRTIVSVKKNGAGYDATVKGHFEGTFEQEGKSHVFVNNASTVDTWTKVGGVWKIAHSKLQSIDATIDSKKVSR